MHRKLRQWFLPALIAVALFAVAGSGFAIRPILTRAAIESSTVIATSPSFRVAGNRIYAPYTPTHQPFIVKGIATPNGHLDRCDPPATRPPTFATPAPHLH